MRSPSLKLLIGIVCLGSGACAARAHLTEGHGRAYGEAFARQAAQPPSQSKQATQGLDAQESASIAGSYRQSLQAKGQAREQPPVLFVAPPGRGRNEPFVPPPSVPEQR
jgi:hypothetical protein